MKRKPLKMNNLWVLAIGVSKTRLLQLCGDQTLYHQHPIKASRQDKGVAHIGQLFALRRHAPEEALHWLGDDGAAWTGQRQVPPRPNYWPGVVPTMCLSTVEGATPQCLPMEQVGCKSPMSYPRSRPCLRSSPPVLRSPPARPSKHPEQELNQEEGNEDLAEKMSVVFVFDADV